MAPWVADHHFIPSGGASGVRSTLFGTEWKLRRMKHDQDNPTGATGLPRRRTAARGLDHGRVGRGCGESASRSPVTENFASYAATFGVYVDSSLNTDITQPALVAPGRFVHDVGRLQYPGGPEQSESGLTIGYTTQLKTVIPVPPARRTYRAAFRPA